MGTASHELEAARVRIAEMEREVNEKDANLGAASQELKAARVRIAEMEREVDENDANLETARLCLSLCPASKETSSSYKTIADFLGKYVLLNYPPYSYI